MYKLKILEGKGYTLVCQTAEELDQYFSKYEDGSLLTYDWETTGLEYNALPLLMSLHFHGDKYPMIVPTDYAFDGIPMEEIAYVCNKHFGRFKLVAHNAKYDSMISVVNGISRDVLTTFADTLVMIHLYNPDMDKQLERRVAEDFKFKKKTFEEWVGIKWSKINWATEGSKLKDVLAVYSAEDAWFETKMYEKYSKLLDDALWKIHNELEMPLIDILRDAKIRGVLIDRKLLEEMSIEAKAERDELLQDIYDECGCVFNLSSPKQKKEVFIDRLGLPILKTTKSGAPSTDADTFSKWAEMGYSIGAKVNEYSILNKLITGYLDSIPQLLDEHNVLRGDLNSCGTKTGRFSSSNPNLQNQPNNPRYPVRKAFIPRPGYVLINYDYSQLELRVMAHMSKDEKFMHIFNSGGDPHGDVTKRLNIPRRSAKVCNFGVLYGMGVAAFAERFKVSIDEAKKIINNYFETYTGFAKWKKQVEAFAESNGFVRNLFGRRRWLPGAMQDRFHRDASYFAALRESVNTIIQGTGADLMKRATIATIRRAKEAGLDAHFLIQVHDENLFEVKESDALAFEAIMKDAMAHTTELCVPLEVDGKIIRDWSEMHDDNILSVPIREHWGEIDSSVLSLIL